MSIFKRYISCFVLIALIVLCFTGCTSKKEPISYPNYDYETQKFLSVKVPLSVSENKGLNGFYSKLPYTEVVEEITNTNPDYTVQCLFNDRMLISSPELGTALLKAIWVGYSSDGSSKASKELYPDGIEDCGLQSNETTKEFRFFQLRARGKLLDSENALAYFSCPIYLLTSDESVTVNYMWHGAVETSTMYVLLTNTNEVEEFYKQRNAVITKTKGGFILNKFPTDVPQNESKKYADIRVSFTEQQSTIFVQFEIIQSYEHLSS